MLVVALFTAPACIPSGRTYTPTQSKKATTAGASGTAEQLEVGQPMLPGDDSVAIQSHLHLDAGRTIGAMHLAPQSGTPCSSGVAASTQLSRFGESLHTSPATSDALALARFYRPDVEESGLLASEPTMLDVTIESADAGQSSCLRIPVIARPDEIEWAQHPTLSLGASVRVAFPLQGVDGYVGGAQGMLRIGGWIREIVRARFELGFGLGGAGADPTPENDGVFGSIPLALVFDRILWSTGQFGLGAELGYEVTWLYFFPREPPDAPAEFRERLHGPRAALRAMLLPPASNLRALRDHPDPFSTSLDFFAALWLSGDPSPTAVLGFQYAGDIGF